MDASPTATSMQRIIRPEPVQASTSGRASRAERDKADDKKQSAPQRTTRYKDKFNSLKEKYEQVTATRLQYERELAVAHDKIKKLESECNLLLDAVDIAAPSQPNILHYLARDPIPPEYHVIARAALPPPLQPAPEPAQTNPFPESNGTRPHSSRATNGTTNGHDSGR